MTDKKDIKEIKDTKETKEAKESDVKSYTLKCKASASLIPNNLSCNGNNLLYVSRNEVHIVKENHDEIVGEKPPHLSTAAYAEKDIISQSCYCKFSFGDCIVIITVTGLIHIYDDSGQKLYHFHKLQKSQVALGVREAHLRGIAHDASHLFIGTGSGEILMFSISLKKFSLTKKIQGHKEMISALECTFIATNDEKEKEKEKEKEVTLVTADEAGTVIFWSVDQKEEGLTKIKEHTGEGYPCLSMCKGHGYIICSYSNGVIRLFDINSKKIKVEISAHTRSINAIDIHPTKPMVVAVSEDSHISLWTLPTSTNKKVTNLLCASPTHALLSGVQFCGKDKSLISVTSYDSRALTFVPIPTN